MVSMRVVKTRKLLAGLDREVDLGAGGPADPVALHGEHAIGPVAFELLHVVQQLVGVGGDAQEPLFQGALFDGRGFVTPAAAVDHLLVGQHGGAERGTS